MDARGGPPAAGAIRYSHYDFFKRLAIKHIARRRGTETVTSRDYDLTDCDALKTSCWSLPTRHEPTAIDTL
ncbi:MAG: hypothetical protein ABW128_12210 [Rhizorhabdus sp.]